jgi:hypothetical protein
MAQHIEEFHIDYEQKRQIMKDVCDEAKALMIILLEAPEEFFNQFLFNNAFSKRRLENYLIFEEHWSVPKVQRVMGDLKRAHERFMSLP